MSDRVQVVQVKAGDLDPGEFFRKCTGQMVYIRLSPGAMAYNGLNTELVYGACYNGNVTSLAPDKLVVLCALVDFVKNIEDERTWEKAVGVIHDQ